VLKVIDNGTGIPESAVADIHSLGLIGMRERTLLLRGEFCIRGVPGKGTTVIVCISLDQSARSE
jgi:signal transduction histidine kinase